jgi:hypothetical protein
MNSDTLYLRGERRGPARRGRRRGHRCGRRVAPTRRMRGEGADKGAALRIASASISYFSTALSLLPPTAHPSPMDPGAQACGTWHLPLPRLDLPSAALCLSHDRARPSPQRRTCPSAPPHMDTVGRARPRPSSSGRPTRACSVSSPLVRSSPGFADGQRVFSLARPHSASTGSRPARQSSPRR